MASGPTIITEPKSHTSRSDREAAVKGSYFLPYQWKWDQDESRRKLCEKSRRVGLTHVEQYRRVRRLAKEGSLYDAYISSKDEGLAKLFIRESKGWANFMKAAAGEWREEIINKEKNLGAFTLEFATGKTLYSLSSNPDAQAGRSGDRTLDEFALHKDQRRLYAIASPGTKWGGQLSIFSSHRSVASYFNFLIKEVREKGNPKKFSLHTITIEDAVKQGLWLKIRHLLPPDDEQKHWTDDEFLQSCRDEMPDEASYLQEYMCVPEDDANSFLTWEMLIACSIPKFHKEWWKEAGPFFVGFDVGRKKDLSVITVLQLVAGQLIQVDEIIMLKTPFSEQRRRLWEILRRPNVSNACIDSSGLGMQMAEESVQEFGEFRVHGVQFTAPVKQELAFPMKTRFEDRTISIFDDRLLHADMRSVKTEATRSGQVLFITEAGETDGHADRFWSMALAVHAAETRVNPGVFQRIRAFERNETTRRAARSSRSYE